ncbi:TonB-dependent receptor [Sphingomonas sabuli]|uniref:TonB-dependent receptor n=1 Tax=Sphingomonas sabuli TaxID=2764186 RepID=UPI001CA3B78B|nr:TonB-dependent receptor [Sphingomonas sabuli]
MLGASTLAICALPQTAFAQDAAPQATAGEAGSTQNEAEADAVPPVTADEAIVVTGIRRSLRDAMNIKRNSQGVVDAISAEDIGKFPDTNLAESLQRITGVSIDRSNGEGSKVTVRGFGPDFNLVLLNGRQMPASTLGDCCSAPASRSFDFANLASEGIAAVEVYKSGRATLPTGGIGSVINIRTPRPLDRDGLQGSISVKGVMDHAFEGTHITPEVSGIISNTFADDRVGVLLSGNYSRRKADLAQFNAGWREGYDGSQSCADGTWGGLPINANDWCGSVNNVENRPGPGETYQVTQNAAYDFINIDRERINGQAVLQLRPTDALTALIDYTFSQNTLDARTNSIGVWFNHSATSSSWTDGPAAGPNFYSEVFGPGKDLAITGALAANRNINKSLGGNLLYDLGRLKLELDAHHSTAVSKPTSPYGSNIAVGSAIFGVQQQTVDFTTDMPVISVDMYPGSEITASNIRPSGNAFRNAYMKDRINEISGRGHYDFDASFIESLDFGVTSTDNKVRTAYGFLQTDSWGGTLSADETPDSLYEMVNLPENLSGMSGSNDPAIIPSYFDIDTEGLIALLQGELGICTAPVSGTPTGTGCLAEYTTDRRIREKTIAPYIQSTHTFDLGASPAHLRLGLRYEKTRITSSALVPVPGNTFWAAQNEIGILDSGQADFTTLKGSYKNWLPAIDFDIEPIRNVKVRGAYSHTITRPDYASLQGGITVSPPLRPNGGSTASSGNPGLLPYKSKNWDLSAEWYYGRESYASAGFFHKTVSNFIGQTTTITPLFDLRNPAEGAAVLAAQAALGDNAPLFDSTDNPTPEIDSIVEYVAANNPELILRNAAGEPIGILATPNDPLVPFIYQQPANSDQKAKIHGFEFALQHSFWNTGFGAILNYTIVNSNTKYNNALPYTTTQFAITGVSDSANAVLFYDKNGIQARVAYNWRDGFLSGYGLDPFYIDPYGQWDVSASYEFRRGLTAFFEGINVTNEDRRGHMRNDQTVFFAAPGYSRYALGLRMTFGGNAAPPPPAYIPPPPPPAAPATQTCPDGTVILATEVCAAPPPPPPPPPPAPERG